MSEIGTCLKSKLVWNPNFCVLRFQTPYVSENYTFGSDLRHSLKFELFGNQTVIKCLKSILVWISDTVFLVCTEVWHGLTLGSHLCLPLQRSPVQIPPFYSISRIWNLKNKKLNQSHFAPPSGKTCTHKVCRSVR